MDGFSSLTMHKPTTVSPRFNGHLRPNLRRTEFRQRAGQGLLLVAGQHSEAGPWAVPALGGWGRLDHGGKTQTKG